MDRPESTTARPAPSAPIVLAHRKTLEAERDRLRNGLAELALKSAKGDTDACAELRSIPEKLAGLQFEIDANHLAHDLANKQDSAAEIAWRADIRALPPEQLLVGLNKDECCRLCQPGIPGGCVLTAGAPHAGTSCWHPTRFGTLHQFSNDQVGRRIIPHSNHPPAVRAFTAALDKLKVRGKFAEILNPETTR